LTEEIKDIWRGGSTRTTVVMTHTSVQIQYCQM